ncbi:MAG: hypothetical protein NTW07_03575, partial [candidate division Zixibacteria bacterium]|nr:hypothetical protein [candidate division Zixibacteria bacterium]
MAERHTKVLKLHILKPVDGMDWRELGGLLRDARYRVFRLANLAVSEAYLNFHRWRSGEKDTHKRTVVELNKDLRELLIQEGVEPGRQDRFSKNGALPANVTDALSQYKLRGVTAPSKWKEVLRGQSSLPTYRL